MPVDVVLDGGWRVSASVLAVDDDHVELGPVDGPLALPGGLRWCPATITWKTKVGAGNRHGILIPSEEGRLVLHPHGKPLRIQRRRYVRVPAELTAAVIGENGRLITRTVDVSVGGMLVEDAEELSLSEEVRFALDLGTVTISGTGKVVRGTGDGARGLAFESLQGRAERALSRFIAERQRAMLRGEDDGPAG